MAFGDIIRSAYCPDPAGVGGDASTIWACSGRNAAEKIYELSIVDFSIIRQAASPGSWGKGIGGDANVIWHCDESAAKIYELSTVDFSVIRFATSPTYLDASGIGGDANTIWHCDQGPQLLYELSIVDFSVIRSAASPGTTPRGIGGKANVIWHCNTGTHRIYELSIVDFSVIRGPTYSFSYPYGIGGTTKILWASSWANDKVYQLLVIDVTTDPATAVGAIAGTLNGTLDNDGDEACDCGFEWGLTAAYGNITPTQSRTTGQTFSQTIGGLDPNTSYHVRAFATNATGTGYGNDEIFTTPSKFQVNKSYALSREEL